jgi:hypothetical protein
MVVCILPISVNPESAESLATSPGPGNNADNIGM